MTHLTASKDALAKVLSAHDPDPCDPIEYDAAAYYRDFADALIASGAVIDASTLADDETLVEQLAPAFYDIDGPDDVEEQTWQLTTAAARDGLRALAAALTERRQS